MHTRHHKHAPPPPSGTTGATTTTKAAVATGDKGHKAPAVSAEVIRACAYRKWERAGMPAGDGIQFWLEAEQELVEGK